MNRILYSFEKLNQFKRFGTYKWIVIYGAAYATSFDEQRDPREQFMTFFHGHDIMRLKFAVECMLSGIGNTITC